MRSLLVANFVALSCFIFVGRIQHSVAACNLKIWEGVPEDEYDMRYASIKEPEGRPLGFNRSIIPYSGDNQPNPCITVENTGGRRIEVMAQSITGSSNICINTQDGNRLCGSALYICDQANANTSTYEFYCLGASCEVVAFQFFFRFTVSQGELDPELWCNDRDTSQYPMSLTPPLPPGRTIPPIRTTKTSSGTTTSHKTNLSMLAVSLFIAIAAWLNLF